MSILEEQETKPAGNIQSPFSQNHELVQELHHRLDALCRYSEQVAESESDPQLQQTWRQFQHQEEECVTTLKEKISGSLNLGIVQDDY
jgi:hypothetical protein